MGRKNNKKKANKGREKSKGGRDANVQLLPNEPPPARQPTFLKQEKRRQINPDEQYFNEPLLLPDKPNMCLDQTAGLALKESLLSLPAENRTATSDRLVKAYGMFDEIEELQKSRSGYEGSDRRRSGMVNINVLKSDSSYIRECVLWIKAFISSDFRAFAPAYVQRAGSPLPDCWTHITSLHTLDENEPQLVNLDSLSFVILLATAIRLTGQERFSLQIVHELHAHAEGGSLDFDELKNHEETLDLDE